jgi:hypothetical protein
MNPLEILKFPLQFFAFFSKERSFAKNPVIGSHYLNKQGLHLNRIKAAATMAGFRRKQLAKSRLLTPKLLDEFEDNGFFLIHDFLPDEEFQLLKQEVLQNSFNSREMRQGQTVTRLTPMGKATLKQFPVIERFYNNPLLKELFYYAASWKGSPVNFIETVFADPDNPKPDPVTELHEDTFHSSGKFWFYLRDVDEDGGPLQYVPGSHKLTPQRLKWEYESSIAACSSDKTPNSYGSFRVSADELAGLGYQQPYKLVVPANTLVVTDTLGFHARSKSLKPTTRLALNGYLRRNPFIPWSGLDFTSLPGIDGRQLELFLNFTDWRERYLKRAYIWRAVGTCKLLDGPHI